MGASAITHTNCFECGAFTAGLTNGVADWLRLCYRMHVYYSESSADADRLQTALSITTSATTMTQLLRETCATW